MNYLLPVRKEKLCVNNQFFLLAMNIRLWKICKTFLMVLFEKNSTEDGESLTIKSYDCLVFLNKPKICEQYTIHESVVIINPP